MSVSQCAHSGCSRTIKNHRWGRTKADGWFQQRNGPAWRARKAAS